MNSSNPQIVVMQMGARRHYAVPVLLHQAGMLGHFFTDAYVGPGSAWQILTKLALLLPASWRPAPLKRLISRREDRLPADKVSAFNLFGFSFAMDLERAGGLKAMQKVHLEYGRRFCELVLKENCQAADGFYAFEGAALPLLQVAKERGLITILEKFSAPSSIAYQLMSEERRLWPHWEPPYPLEQEVQERIELEHKEWDAAQAIICGSDFVAQGLRSLGVPAEKIHTVPSGLELSRFAVKRERWQGQRPLRVLFVGGITLGKGPQYLFEALQKLNSTRFAARMVGPMAIQEPYRRRLRERAELTGQVTRQEVLRHYAWADIFVFPSICEGSAMVTYEALAAGLPVITTPNAGSVVRDGVDGFIVPIRDSEAIGAKLELLANDPGLLAQMAENARARASEFSWEKYGDRLIAVMTKIMSGKIQRTS